MKKDSSLGLGLAGAAMAVMLAGSGCATYATLDVRVDVPGNPAAGKAVTITRVADKRVFEPTSGWSVNLARPVLRLFKKADRANTNILNRSIAYRPSGGFDGLGAYLLPDGRNVEGLVADILARSFREAGYRVVDPRQGAAEKATPVEAEVEYFWCGYRDEFFASAMPFEARIRVSGDLPALRSVEPVCARLTLRTQNIGLARNWMKTIDKGIEVLVKELKQRLGSQAASAAPPPDSPAPESGDKTPAGKDDPTERLKKLEQMRKDGVITEEEHQKKRQAIIDEI